MSAKKIRSPEPHSVAPAGERCVSDWGLGGSRDELSSAVLWQKGLHSWLCSGGSNKCSRGGDLCREAIGENGTASLLLSKNSFDSYLRDLLGFIESEPETICVPEKKLWVFLFVCGFWFGLFVTFSAAVQSVCPGKLADK